MDIILKRNFIYLFILQNANYIIPLLLLPYLTHVLGAGNYGKVAFAQAFISYFTLITDFGFNTSSTQSIAKVQYDKLEISRIFWNTISAKSIFAILSFIILVLSIIIFPKLRLNSTLLFVAYLGVISSVIFPTWLFQGTERMSLVTILSVFPRIMVLLATFLLIKCPGDYLLSLLIQVIGTLVTSFLSLLLIFRNKLVFFVKPTYKDIYTQIYESWHIFISGFATSIYTTTNIVVLGFLVNDSAVGIYSAADKIVRAIISLSSSITQVTFPRINVYFIESKEKAIQFANKLLKIISSINFGGGVLLIILAPYIVSRMFGVPEYNETIVILRITSFLPFFAIANGIIAINIFVTFNLKSVLAKIVGQGGLFSIIIIFPMTYFFKTEGVAYCALMTEILISFLLFRNLKCHQIKILNMTNILKK
jgi:PST family polysaccharide transporter